MNESSKEAPKHTGGDRLAAVQSRVDDFYKGTLSALAQRYLFELPRTQHGTAVPPTVLVLGNHSSGKSTFVNYLLKEEVQRTGLAPVDDGFTIITHGGERTELDGPAVISHPSYPWRNLERFGPALASRLKLKTIPVKFLQRLTVIDSPGMIDSSDSKMDRGYDFPAVIRFLAEAADVILLFFDPDKPGTTGETTSILKESLAGMDHKLLIVMNKVDRFENMRDFARAYGALCWNLARVISTKDLPHIFNMYIPGLTGDEGSGIPLKDFDIARKEVIHEVSRAPHRRAQNAVSRLYESARRLDMHVKVCSRTTWELAKARLMYYVLIAITLALTVVLVTLVANYALAGAETGGFSSVKPPLYTGIVGVLLAGIIYGMSRFDRQWRERSILAGIDDVFRSVYARELATASTAAGLESLWHKVRDKTVTSLKALGPSRFSLAFPGKLNQRRLKRAIETGIPALRAGVEGASGDRH